MNRVAKAIYQISDGIDACIKAREQDAAQLPPGEPKQSILKEIAQLRVYAEAERGTISPGCKPGA
jgi:hypothetical protein